MHGSPERLRLVMTVILAFGLATPATAQLANLNRRDAVVQAVEKVSPAVVNISTEVLVRNPYASSPDIFEWFFGGARRQPRETYVENSLGSGVIVNERGYVLTNDHVVSAASRITITFQDGRQVEAKLLGSDEASDLAVLMLQEKGPWPAAKMGSSSDLMIGETVIAIGNPFGLQSTVTVGVVSATGRTVAGPDRTALPFADFIQTDAAINPGNSGGALLNILGELIGVNAQIVAKGQNLGFAIPIDRAKKVVDELVTYGHLRPPWTGLVAENLDAQQAAYYGIDQAAGALIVKVYADSPGEEAGVLAGDIVTQVGSHRVKNLFDFVTAIAEVRYGQRVNLRLLREKEELVRPIRVEAFPKRRAKEFAWNLLGFTVAQRGQYVIINRIRSGSRAEAKGFVPGLQLRRINGKIVRSEDDFYEGIPQAMLRRSVNLLIATRRGLYPVTLPVR